MSGQFKGKWYYTDSAAKTHGPVPLEELQKQYGSGDIDDDTFVWNSKVVDRWCQVNQVGGLNDALRGRGASRAGEDKASDAGDLLGDTSVAGLDKGGVDDDLQAYLNDEASSFGGGLGSEISGRKKSGTKVIDDGTGGEAWDFDIGLQDDPAGDEAGGMGDLFGGGGLGFDTATPGVSGISNGLDTLTERLGNGAGPDMGAASSYFAGGDMGLDGMLQERIEELTLENKRLRRRIGQQKESGTHYENMIRDFETLKKEIMDGTYGDTDVGLQKLQQTNASLRAQLAAQKKSHEEEIHQIEADNQEEVEMFKKRLGAEVNTLQLAKQVQDEELNEHRINQSEMESKLRKAQTTGRRGRSGSVERIKGMMTNLFDDLECAEMRVEDMRDTLDMANGEIRRMKGREGDIRSKENQMERTLADIAGKLGGNSNDATMMINGKPVDLQELFRKNLELEGERADAERMIREICKELGIDISGVDVGPPPECTTAEARQYAGLGPSDSPSDLRDRIDAIDGALQRLKRSGGDPQAIQELEALKQYYGDCLDAANAQNMKSPSEILGALSKYDDGSGHVPCRDLEKVMEDLGVPRSDSRSWAQEYMRNRGLGPGDKCDKNDFADWFEKKQAGIKSPEEIMKALNRFDYNNNGQIPVSELPNILSDLDVPSHQRQAIIDKFKQDQGLGPNDKFNKYEFSNWFQKEQTERAKKLSARRSGGMKLKDALNRIKQKLQERGFQLGAARDTARNAQDEIAGFNQRQESVRRTLGEEYEKNCAKLRQADSKLENAISSFDDNFANLAPEEKQRILEGIRKANREKAAAEDSLQRDTDAKLSAEGRELQNLKDEYQMAQERFLRNRHKMSPDQIRREEERLEAMKRRIDQKEHGLQESRKAEIDRIRQSIEGDEDALAKLKEKYERNKDNMSPEQRRMMEDQIRQMENRIESKRKRLGKLVEDDARAMKAAVSSDEAELSRLEKFLRENRDNLSPEEIRALETRIGALKGRISKGNKRVSKAESLREQISGESAANRSRRQDAGFLSRLKDLVEEFGPKSAEEILDSIRRKFGKGGDGPSVQDEYRRRLQDIFRSHAPDKVQNIDKLLDRYKGREHQLYEQVCAKYGVVPETEYFGPEESGDINVGKLRRQLEMQKQKHERALKTLAQSLTQEHARQMEMVNAKVREKLRKRRRTPGGPDPNRGPPKLVNVMKKCQQLRVDLEWCRATLYYELDLIRSGYPQLKNAIMKFKSGENAVSQRWRGKYNTERKGRRRFEDNTMNLKGQVKAYCRVRPIQRWERARNGGENVISMERANPGQPNERVKLLADNGRLHEFTFEEIWKQNTDNRQIFERLQPYCHDVMEGYNVTIINYGTSRSGKTFTLQGDSARGIPGLAALMVRELFGIKERRRGYEYKITASYVEVYKGDIYDITRENQPTPIQINCNASDNLVQDIGVHAANAQRLAITSEQDLEVNLLSEANKRRQEWPEYGKRRAGAHTILYVYVLGQNLNIDLTFRGRLMFVDLGNSTRITPDLSYNSGGKLVSGKHMDPSLDALGEVFKTVHRRSLDGRKDQSYDLGFDAAPITQLLQDSLENTKCPDPDKQPSQQGSGEMPSKHAKTIIIANVSPSAVEAADTLKTLQFASDVRGTIIGKVMQQRRDGVIEGVEEGGGGGLRGPYGV